MIGELITENIHAHVHRVTRANELHCSGLLNQRLSNDTTLQEKTFHGIDFLNTGDVLYSNANPVDYEDDFLPVLPPNAMSSRDGDCVFVNPPPEGAPKSPKHSLESPIAPEQTSSRRTKPPSINENTSQENDDSNSASIHGKFWCFGIRSADKTRKEDGQTHKCSTVRIPSTVGP